MCCADLVHVEYEDALDCRRALPRSAFSSEVCCSLGHGDVHSFRQGHGLDLVVRESSGLAGWGCRDLDLRPGIWGEVTGVEVRGSRHSCEPGVWRLLGSIYPRAELTRGSFKGCLHARCGLRRCHSGGVESESRERV